MLQIDQVATTSPREMVNIRRKIWTQVREMNQEEIRQSKIRVDELIGTRGMRLSGSNEANNPPGKEKHQWWNEESEEAQKERSNA